MLKRKIAPLLRRRLSEYPAAALIGPRQAGKTTLARSLGGEYFDLEQGPARLELDLRWDELVRGKKRIVLDEAQSWPDIFPRLRGAIDANRRRNGKFLLLGSVSPALMKHVSESLAGRLALVELTPFLLNEVSGKARERHWLVGGFPDGGILKPRNYPHWQQDYVALLTQRDLPNWGMPAQPQVTQRLLKMAAAVHGQMFNASQLGQSLGLSFHTVKSYIDYLSGAFIVRLLPPLHANLTKRLVKTPKLYWRDTGLLHSVLNVAGAEALLTQAWVGASWEGYCIEQVLGALQQYGIQADAYHLRTSDQLEIDLVLDFGREKWALEVKLTSSPDPGDMERLNRAADLIGARKRILVSKTGNSVASRNEVSCNLDWLLSSIKQLL